MEICLHIEAQVCVCECERKRVSSGRVREGFNRRAKTEQQCWGRLKQTLVPEAQPVPHLVGKGGTVASTKPYLKPQLALSDTSMYCLDSELLYLKCSPLLISK